MVIVAIAATAGEDKILIGTTANGSGAFSAETPNSLAVGIYTIRGSGDLGSEATAPLVVVQEK